MQILRFSIRAKLFVIIFLVATVSLLLSYFLSGWLQYSTVRQELLEKVQINARLVGEYCVVPLTFEDKAAALKVLKKLETIQITEAAHLYDKGKSLFASYSRDESISPTTTAPPLTSGDFRQESLFVVVPVNYEGEQYGTIAIQVSYLEVKEKLTALFVSLVPAMLSLLLLSALLAFWLQSLISAPILHLATILQNVSGKADKTIKLPEGRHDEIGELYGAYNVMLDRLAQHDHRRDKAEQDLRSSEQKFRNLIESITECFWEVDEELRLIYVSPIFEEITGYSFNDVKGLRLDELAGSSSAGEEIAGNITAAMRTREAFKMVEDSFLRKDGKKVLLEASGIPILDNENHFIGYRGITRDLTEQKHLEQQFRQSQKMEAMGTLAGGIAHDFNNILSAILGYTELAKIHLPVDAKAGQQDLDQVLKAGHRATDLVKQILTFSRKGEENLKPLKVQYLIKEVLKLLRSSLPTTIQLNDHIAAGCRQVLADPTQLHQVLMNLCTNAKQAIGEDIGTLTVSLSEVQITNSTRIADCPQITHGWYLDLEIKDSGCGMDSLTQSKIFDPFFTTKEKGKGTGLGLSVVHGIIKQHKGAITVTSEPGEGTTFHVYLPVIEENEISEAEQDIIHNIPRGNGERILFVDDEIVIANMMEQILIDLGYLVTVFTSSTKALSAYENDPENIDLLITDMTMPEMTGVDLSRKILALHPDLPIILCTGFSETVDEEKAKSIGISEYVKKPIDKHTLAKAIRAVLKR